MGHPCWNVREAAMILTESYLVLSDDFNIISEDNKNVLYKYVKSGKR